MLTLEQKSKVKNILSDAEKSIKEAIGCDLHLIATHNSGLKIVLTNELEKTVNQLTRDEILRRVIVEVTGVKWIDIESKRRKREQATARHLYCYFAYNWVRFSWNVTAANVGRVDHTSAMYSAQTVEDLVSCNDEKMKLLFTQIKNKLNAALL